MGCNYTGSMLRCAITPGELASMTDAGERARAAAALVARASNLAEQGVDLLIVREKELASGELVGLVREIVRAVAERATRVLVARRPDVAIVAGAGGVHLSAEAGELRPEQIRRLMPGAFVSVSCHSDAEIRIAVLAGADAVLFAPVFGKWVGSRQASEGLGLERLRQAAQAGALLPVFALGGVRAEDVRACREAGAAGVAGIRLFFG
jgi:thiamine-phosphate pyrophosphorylase